MNAGQAPGDDIQSVAKAAKTFVSVVLGVVGAITAIAGIWSSSLVVALNIAGVIGVVTLTFGVITWASASKSDPVRRIRTTAIVVAVSALIAGTFFAVGRPLEGDERDFGLLTIIGIANLLALGTLAILAWQTIEAKARPPMKTCPECAEEVLAAASKCKHCGYRFAPAQP